MAQLFIQSKRLAKLEEDVSQALMNLYTLISKQPFLEDFPDWIGTGAVEAAKHYQDFGVTFFHLKTSVYLLTIVAVVLMFLWKKIGFQLYVATQLFLIFSIIYGFGTNVAAIILAIMSGFICLIFILLYKKYFLIPLNKSTHPRP